MVWKFSSMIENFMQQFFGRSAFMFEGIVRLHPFVDGNKRTALASIQEYLLEKGYIFIMPVSAVRFTIKVASINSMESDRINSLMKDIAT
jgi:death-on-curing family protein